MITPPHRSGNRRPWKRLILVAIAALTGCGYHFSGAPGDTPFSPNIKTIEIRSARNDTTITGIETELTNRLRNEFAVGTRLEPVRSGGNVILNTIIASYKDTPAAYQADGKELTRIGTLKVLCNLDLADRKKTIWQKTLSSSHSYLVTDSISETLANRRKAISTMIDNLIVRIHGSLYDNF